MYNILQKTIKGVIFDKVASKITEIRAQKTKVKPNSHYTEVR